MSRIFFVVLNIALSSMIIACTTTTTRIESGSIAVENKEVKAGISFGAQETEKIKHYFGGKTKEKRLPPGLAKKEELPPGLQKHIEKYGELPPGVAGKRLPSELEKTLTRLPENYVRLKVGGDVVLMNEKTRVVFDVIWNVD